MRRQLAALLVHADSENVLREGFLLSADGWLTPAKKGQKPSDLKYFQSRK